MAIQSDVEVIGHSNGEMLNVHNVAAPATITGGSVANNYSGASGLVINWRTAGVRNGRRVRGRTFLVPLAGGAYGTDGTIDNANITETVTAATALYTTASPIKLGVWARPKRDDLGNITEDGSFHPVVAASVPDMAAVLRSRR
jgi:hypothetical protein